MRCYCAYVVSSLSVALAVTVACAPSTRSIATSAGRAPLAARPAVPGAPAGITAFIDVNVVSMVTERVLSHQTVLVQYGRITALGPSQQLTIPANATRIDAQGRYLIPGLADMHAHIGASYSHQYDSAAVEQRLFLWLTQGVTTVRGMDYMSASKDIVSGPKQLDPTSILRLRARAAAGTLWGPRIYTSGPWAPAPTAVPPESVATYVAAYKAAGYDHLKPHDERLEVVDSLAAAARRVGMPLAGHVIGTAEHAIALNAYRSIEHLTGYGMGSNQAPDVAALVAKTPREGIWNCPTQLLSESQSPERELAIRRQLIKALQDAGAGLLLGTDLPAVWRKDKFDLTRPRDQAWLRTLGDPGAVHGELEALVRAGLTPYQALATGTKNVAAYFQTVDETGTVAVGKRADLVLLSGNPLVDIRQTAEPAGVMIGGRWLARDELNRRVATIEGLYAATP